MNDRAALICFTSRGIRTALRVQAALKEAYPEWTVQVWCKKKSVPAVDQKPGSAADEAEQVQQLAGGLRDFTAERFADCGCLVFVGATGIAVRTIAPFLKSKKTDPAVICADEHGRFVIALVSGHIGGANEIASAVAGRIGAIPVVTTATDLNGLFAVDVFAVKNHLAISDMALAKEAAAQMLDGKKILFTSELPSASNFCARPEAEQMQDSLSSGQMADDLPAGLALDPAQADASMQIHVGIHPVKVNKAVLYLVPKAVTLGIGCKRNTDPEKMSAFVKRVLAQAEILPAAVAKVCSIDLKKDEKAIQGLAAEYGVPFVTYTAEELKLAPGEFASSAFVEKTVGVSNVCERSAVLGGMDLQQVSCTAGKEDQAAGNIHLIIGKTAENGMTAAAAATFRRFYFE